MSSNMYYIIVIIIVVKIIWYAVTQNGIYIFSSSISSSHSPAAQNEL